MARSIPTPVSFNLTTFSCRPEHYEVLPGNKINQNVYLAMYLDHRCSLEQGHFADQQAAIAAAHPGTTAAQQQTPLVVVKRIRLESLTDLQYNNLVQEVAYSRLYRHPNLLPFLTTFTVRNELWQVMPVAEFGSCYELAKPYGMPEICIALIVRDVIKALCYLHENSIIHHGVRSSRVMVTGNGRCLLAGFKYSMSMVRDRELYSTVYKYPNNAKPNLKWLAPEVLEQNLYGYDEKADIYSLGILCCELANGCPPFEDLQPTEMLLDKLSGNFPKPMDATCEELMHVDFSDMPPNEREKYGFYIARLFSKYFHNFTVENCLKSDVNLRPFAHDLLKHKFLRQIRSKDNLIQLLPKKDSVFQRFNKKPIFAAMSSNRSTPEPEECICNRRRGYCECYPSRPNSAMDNHNADESDQEWDF